MKECRSNASQRRSANSVAAWIPRRSVAASQRRSRVAASPRRSANSVAASIPRRSAAPASQHHSVAASLRLASVAASQRQQRCSVTGPRQRRSVAASQRHSHSVAAPPAPLQSVAASQRHPPPGASQRNVGNPRFGPLCPSTVVFVANSVYNFATYDLLRQARFVLQTSLNGGSVDGLETRESRESQS